MKPFAALVAALIATSLVVVAAPAQAQGTIYYLHSVSTSNNVDEIAGGNSFDTSTPTFTDDSYAADIPVVRQNGESLVDADWAGHVGEAITSLSVDFWQMAPVAESTCSGVDYDITISNGTTEFALPTLNAADDGSNVPAEVKGTFATMLTPDGKNQIPLNVPAGDLSFKIQDHFVNCEAGAVVVFDSTSHPSDFTVNPGGAPAPSPSSTGVAPSPTSSPVGGGTSGPQTLSGSISFGTPIELPKSSEIGSTTATCLNPCGEPSLVQAPDGTMYISTPRTLDVCCNSKASPVWASTDGGATWSNPIFPSSTVPGGAAASGGDTEMAVDKNNTLYEGDLWLGNDSMFITSDAGKTWTSSPFSHDIGADREWLVYNPKDDALYGWYDGLKAGLEVVRAPLNTPAGSKTALLAPQETLAVPVRPPCNSLACVNGVPSGPFPNEVNGVPVLSETESPGIPTVDPRTGTVYFPFGYQVAGKGIGIAKTTDGLNFTYDYVPGAGHGSVGDVDNDFPAAAVDGNGTLYVAWVEDKSGHDNAYHVYVSSKKQGAQWIGPTDVSGAISKTAVFPTMAAGAGGRVVVGWYGTDVAGNNNDATAMKNANWNVYVAESVDAVAANPTFDQLENVDPNFHTGTISTGGLGGKADRSLLDFFTVGIDSKSGNADVTYTRTKGQGTAIMFAKQNGGCNLLTADPCPVAQPSPTASASVSSSPTTAPSPTPAAQGTTLTFTKAVPASGQYSDQITLAAQLKDSSGHGVAGQAVTFDVAGQANRRVSATTDANGVASTQLRLDVPPGSYALSGSYAGVTDAYKASNDQQPLSVLKKDTAVSASSTASGSKKTVSARLTKADDPTTGIAGIVLSLYADGAYVGDATTDGSGAASFAAPGGTRGKKTTYEVRFGGNDYYEASSAQAV